jgi:hypothetical protein
VTSVAEAYDSLLDFIGNRRVVMIGEASHGTHESYRERAQIPRRLIDEQGLTVVAVRAVTAFLGEIPFTWRAPGALLARRGLLPSTAS